jgi:hypothetical protein
MAVGVTGYFFGLIFFGRLMFVAGRLEVSVRVGRR